MSRELEWTAAFSVGHLVLDAEHMGLIARINEVCANRTTGGRRSLVEGLIQDVRHHFEHEDEILQKVVEGDSRISSDAKAMSQSAILEHIAEHARALIQLEALTAKFAAADIDDLPQHYDALKSWFIDHAVKHDAHLKAVFQAM
jgi:hemerythrin-like metal-binding protein